MSETDGDLLVLREAMAFNGGVRHLDPQDLISRARRRRFRHGAGAAVTVVAVSAAGGVGVAAVNDAPSRAPEPAVSGPPAPVETLDADVAESLDFGWVAVQRPRNDGVCLRREDGSDDRCFIGIGEVTGSYGEGVGSFYEPETASGPALMAWLVPAETSTTVVTAKDGSALTADVYALTGSPGGRLAVLFVHDEPAFWTQPNRQVVSYDSTGEVVADWSITNYPDLR